MKREREKKKTLAVTVYCGCVCVCDGCIHYVYMSVQYRKQLEQKSYRCKHKKS